MIRLTLLLCASMFLVLLIGGRDYGQRRPGLAIAAQDAVAPPAEAAPAPVAVAAPSPTQPDDELADRLSLPLVVAPAPVAEPAGTQAAAVAGAAAPPAPAADAEGTVWLVSAEAVNVREGPSTSDAVLDRLAQDEAVLVLWTDDTGWARIRIEGDGVEGYVYANYLIPAVPGN